MMRPGATVATRTGNATPTPALGAPVTGWEKAYFAIVGLSALWIGAWGYLAPSVQRSIPFDVPELHARFLGAMYLSAVALMLGGLLKARWSEIAVLPAMTAIWTGGIFVVSILHLELFDRSTPQSLVWLIAYAVYPLIAIALAWVHRAELRRCTAGDPIALWVRRYLLSQAIVLGVLAIALAIAPSAMVDAWPWPITDVLAQLYAAPFASYAAGSLLLSRAPSWSQAGAGVVALAVFAGGVLIASALHRDLFSAAEAADVLWFAAFTLATTVLVAMNLRSGRHA